jgi:hypothetical protein
LITNSHPTTTANAMRIVVLSPGIRSLPHGLSVFTWSPFPYLLPEWSRVPRPPNCADYTTFIEVTAARRCLTEMVDAEGFFSKVCDWSAFPREGPARRVRTNQLNTFLTCVKSCHLIRHTLTVHPRCTGVRPAGPHDRFGLSRRQWHHRHSDA